MRNPECGVRNQFAESCMNNENLKERTKECNELVAIVVASIRTAKKNRELNESTRGDSVPHSALRTLR